MIWPEWRTKSGPPTLWLCLAALLACARPAGAAAALVAAERPLSLLNAVFDLLPAALEAGQAAGGDRRGMQSAAILVVKEDGGVWLNNDVVLRLQVDDSAEPIRELRRLVEKSGR